MKVTPQHLPRGFTAWPNGLGADSRTWSCVLHPNANGTVLEQAKSLRDLPGRVRRQSRRKAGIR